MYSVKNNRVCLLYADCMFNKQHSMPLNYGEQPYGLDIQACREAQQIAHLKRQKV